MFEPSGRHVGAWHGGGAAKRRRDRRLRMHWRHEQLTLQMALAAALHHSRDVGPVMYNALRSQKTARAEATNNALRSQKTSVAGDTEFFSLYEEELGGTLPDRLAGVRPQVWVVQRTVEQTVDPVPVVPLLHDAEPQLAEQLVEVPTILYFLKQKVDIPVPHRGGWRFSRTFFCFCGADRSHSSSAQWCTVS